MKSKVFELVENTNELVVLKVKAEDNFVIALNPYVSGDMDYITVTKGEKHILTVIRKDGTTFSFHWGIGGHTCISEGLEVLKKKVIHFIEKECFIPLELDFTDVSTLKVFFNHNFDKWEIAMEGMGHKNAFMYTEYGLEDTEKIAEKVLGKKITKWEQRIAPTGIDIWVAVF